MKKDTDLSLIFAGCFGILVLVAVLAAISAAILIFAINGLFGLELAYSLENLFYAWLLLMCLGANGSVSSSKK